MVVQDDRLLGGPSRARCSSVPWTPCGHGRPGRPRAQRVPRARVARQFHGCMVVPDDRLLKGPSRARCSSVPWTPCGHGRPGRPRAQRVPRARVARHLHARMVVPDDHLLERSRARAWFANFPSRSICITGMVVPDDHVQWGCLPLCLIPQQQDIDPYGDPPIVGTHCGLGVKHGRRVVTSPPRGKHHSRVTTVQID